MKTKKQIEEEFLRIFNPYNEKVIKISFEEVSKVLKAKIQNKPKIYIQKLQQKL